MILFLYVFLGITILGTAIETMKSMCKSKLKLYAFEAVVITCWPIVVILVCVMSLTMWDDDD